MGWIEQTVFNLIRQEVRREVEAIHPGGTVQADLTSNGNYFVIKWSVEFIDKETGEWKEESFEGEKTFSKIDALRKVISGDEQLEDNEGF
jgi:hypothetical protein